MRRVRFFAVAVLFAGMAAATAGQASGSGSNDPCNIQTTERVVAIGDIHGAYDRFVAILKTAGLVDDRERWAGGRTILVQTGDVVDRGPDSRRALDLLRRLASDAPRAGGRVHALVGNHEVMRMMSDLRYVSAEDYAAFRSPDSESLRDRYYELSRDGAERAARAAKQRFDESAFRKEFFARTPLGLVELQLAFGPKGEYGRWVSSHDTMLRINGIVFVHGGISPRVAPLGCQSINDTVRRELTKLPVTDPDVLAAMLAPAEDGPLWYRGLAQEDEASFAKELERIISAIDARAIVIGHTVAEGGRIRPRFDGRVIQIDTGMLGAPFYSAGRPSALEIVGDRFTAIYEDGKVSLASPLSAK